MIAGRRIGLGSHQATIGKLAHAGRVGQLHPFTGVGIARYGSRVHQRWRGCVNIPVIISMAGRLEKAVQVGFAGIVETRQIALRFEKIARGIVRPIAPVDATHIFTPADNLANKALDRSEWCIAVRIFLLRLATQVEGGEQAYDDVGRQQRVIKERLARQHGILIIAETRQTLGEKMAPHAHRFLVRHCELEVIEAARMIGKTLAGQIENFPGRLVGAEGNRLGHEQIGIAGSRFS